VGVHGREVLVDARIGVGVVLGRVRDRDQALVGGRRRDEVRIGGEDGVGIDDEVRADEKLVGAPLMLNLELNKPI
jgi:hypothetical protein